MVNWIDNISTWDGRLPATLVAIGLPPEQREAELRALVAHVLHVHPDSIAVERVNGRPPVLVRPAGRRLYLSTSSRSRVAAMAVAGSQVGVDVEVTDSEAEIPWNVLHANEVAKLASLKGGERSCAFARLWSLKEAYLKALGTGLSREPSSFAVSFVDEESAVIDDSIGSRPAEAETRWHAGGAYLVAISVVVLEPQPPDRSG
jgi:phosphopantetheinyl transferase